MNIYILKNPITQEIFYVGCTEKKLEQRLKAHYWKLNEAKRGEINFNKRLKYLDNLLPNKAEIHLIDTCEWKDHVRIEEKYIELYKNLNPNLTNQTFGGIGGDTFTLQTEEQQLTTGQKISLKIKGRKLTEEQLKFRSESRKGYGNPVGGYTKYSPICIESKTEIIIFRNAIECSQYYQNKNKWKNLIDLANFHARTKVLTKNKNKQIVTFIEDCRPKIKDIVQSILEREGYSYFYDKETKKLTVK